MTFQLILDKIKNNLKKILDDLSISDVNFSVEVAKTSIALGNASDAVRSEATMTVSGCSGDGVLEALDKLAPTLSEI